MASPKNGSAGTLPDALQNADLGELLAMEIERGLKMVQEDDRANERGRLNEWAHRQVTRFIHQLRQHHTDEPA